jgi:hypothetical protein
VTTDERSAERGLNQRGADLVTSELVHRGENIDTAQATTQTERDQAQGSTVDPLATPKRTWRYYIPDPYAVIYSFWRSPTTARTATAGRTSARRTFASFFWARYDRAMTTSLRSLPPDAA